MLLKSQNTASQPCSVIIVCHSNTKTSKAFCLSGVHPVSVPAAHYVCSEKKSGLVPTGLRSPRLSREIYAAYKTFRLLRSQPEIRVGTAHHFKFKFSQSFLRFFYSFSVHLVLSAEFHQKLLIKHFFTILITKACLKIAHNPECNLNFCHKPGNHFRVHSIWRATSTYLAAPLVLSYFFLTYICLSP